MEQQNKQVLVGAAARGGREEGRRRGAMKCLAGLEHTGPTRGGGPAQPTVCPSCLLGGWLVDGSRAT